MPRDGVALERVLRALPPEEHFVQKFIDHCREFLLKARKQEKMSASDLDQEKYCNDRSIKLYERNFAAGLPFQDSIHALNYRACAGATF